MSLASLFLASCAPFPQDFFRNLNRKPAPKSSAPTIPALKTAEELAEDAAKEEARLKANAEAAERRALKEAAEEAARVSENRPPSSVTRSPSKYRTAMAIPGKPGFVFNPWTNKAVDVRGLPSGVVVRDPNDTDPSHKFRVP